MRSLHGRERDFDVVVDNIARAVNVGVAEETELLAERVKTGQGFVVVERKRWWIEGELDMDGNFGFGEGKVVWSFAAERIGQSG